MYQALGDDPLTDIDLNQMQCKSSVTNEAFALFGQRPFDEKNPLTRVRMDYFEYMHEALDASAYADFVSMCGGLQRLIITNMFPSGGKFKDSLGMFAAAMIAEAGTNLIELNVE